MLITILHTFASLSLPFSSRPDSSESNAVYRYDKTAIAQMSRLDREAAKRKEKNRQQQEELVK
eukprot:5514-Amorphochlora_amoeboformis.AAC.1